MRKLLKLAIAAAIVASPLSLAAAFAQTRYHEQGSHRGDHDADRLNGSQRDAGRYRDNQYDGRARNGREARQHRVEWRDDRRDAQWDDVQHNGYYNGDAWRFGRPPMRAADRADYRYGYHPWSRGDRLGYYADRYERADYRQFNRRQPRRGYRWVRDDRGDYLLYAIATGVIADVIINSRY